MRARVSARQEDMRALAETAVRFAGALLRLPLRIAGRGRWPAASPPAFPEPALVLRGDSTTPARAVFLVENVRTEDVTVRLAVSPFRDSAGRVAAPEVHLRPAVFTLGPHEDLLVEAMTILGEDLEAGIPYHATVSLDGLGDAVLPIAAVRDPVTPAGP